MDGVLGVIHDVHVEATFPVDTKLVNVRHPIRRSPGTTSHRKVDPLRRTQFWYQGLSGACTAALKLIRIGQDGCQRALTLALKELPNVVTRSLTIQRSEAGCFSPLSEIATMRHLLAEERLFMS